MKSIFIDTNAILRFVLNDDKEQSLKTKSLFQQAENNEIKIFLIAEIIAEIIYVLSKFYDSPKSECALVVKELLQNNYINIVNLQKDILLKAIDIYEESNIDFVDSLLITQAIKEKANIFTFYKKMSKIFKENSINI